MSAFTPVADWRQALSEPGATVLTVSVSDLARVLATVHEQSLMIRTRKEAAARQNFDDYQRAQKKQLAAVIARYGFTSEDDFHQVLEAHMKTQGLSAIDPKSTHIKLRPRPGFRARRSS